MPCARRSATVCCSRFGTATIGVVLMGLLAWLIYRSRLPGSGLIEYIVMFPQAVPRLVFAFGMMWAWVVFPIPIYGTLWLLLIAYLTVFLPLGVRTIAGVMLQIDKSLEECAQMCGASWAFRVRTVTMPLLWPGLIAAWLLLFIASVRELGASILLMGPHSKVITPSIVESWFGTSSELTATLALIQTLVVALAMIVLVAVTRRVSAHTPSIEDARHTLHMPRKPHIEVEGLELYYGSVPAVRGVSFNVMPGEQLTLLGPSGCGKTTTLRAIAGLEQPTAGEIRIDGVPVYLVRAQDQHSGRKARPVDGVPVLCDLAAHDRVRQRRLRTARAQSRRGGNHGKGAIARSTWCRCATSRRDARRSCPAASSSAWRWRAPSCSSRRCCCSTSRCRISTPSCAPTCASSLRDLQHRLGITSLYVTHDLEEALAMSDRIVVMRDGLVEQTGTPDEIYSLPRSAFVADFIGSANLIRGRHRPDLDGDGLIALETAAGQIIYGMAYGRPASPEMTVSVRTVHLRISQERPVGERNVWPVKIEKTVFQGDFTQVHLCWGDQRLVARCAAMEPIAAGRDVYMTVEPRRVVLLGAENT